MSATLISTYRVVGDRVHVTTPYSEGVIKACREMGGKFEGGAWVLPAARLGRVQEQIGRDLEDLVQVDVPSGDTTGYAQVRIGWHVLAGRRSRDARPDIYADLVAGTIPSSGGSVKHPAVNESDDSVFRLWVPRDFAVARSLTVVTDPLRPTVPDESAAAGVDPGTPAGVAADRLRDAGQDGTADVVSGRAAVIARIRELLREHGLTVSDL